MDKRHQTIRPLTQYHGIAYQHEALGEIAVAQGTGALAAAHFEEALNLSRDLADRAATAWCVAGLAGVAMLAEEPGRAVRLWSAAQAQRHSLGARDAPVSRTTRERLMEEARKQLGEEAFAAAWAEGQAMTMEQAIELALQSQAEA